MGFRWTDSPSDVFPAGFDAYRAAMHDGLLAIAERRAPEIEAWMQENAPWTDRTADARQGLHAEVFDLVELISIVLWDDMFYEYFLEIRQAGKFAIINPAIDYWSEVVWNDVRELTRL